MQVGGDPGVELTGRGAEYGDLGPGVRFLYPAVTVSTVSWVTEV